MQPVANAKTNQTSRQILFVDDEPDFLQVLKETFGMLSGGTWTIYCASNAQTALDLLKRQNVDLAVVDMNMPLLDGIQFLNLLGKRYPNLKKITLTAFATEEKRSQCLANGAELVIEKPRTPEGFKSVFAMLDDLVSWTPQQGFQGMLRRVGLQDVIQMECLGRNSSVLEVRYEQVHGQIFIEDGSIIHAHGDGLMGEPALQRLLALPGGSFELMPFAAPPQRTIEGQWESLLMEAARVRDENAAQEPPAAKVDDAKGATSTAVSTAIVETLICSGQGEPLYHAHCADVSGCVERLKRIAAHAAELAQMLPLGNFDRLEMQFVDGRAIAQARADRLVFVRTAYPPATP
jgi:CheY-like chemotaxis protein